MKKSSTKSPKARPKQSMPSKPAKPRRIRDDKLARWIDLLAALLRRGAPAMFEDIRADIPAYNATVASHDTVMRMFERDKDELRSAGIPIETVAFSEDEIGYRLRRTKFYLPYLDLLGAPPRARVKRWEYQGLLSFTMAPDDTDLLAAAARRAESLGASVARDARSAAKKLAFDLPIVVDRSEPDTEVSSEDHGDPETLDVLVDAIRRRKRLEISYEPVAPSDDHARQGTRHVEGYGLFFLSGHWYLAARDTDRGALRNFRVSRVEVQSVNKARAQSPDYEIPADFDLRLHARARQAWELGDEQDSEVIVEVLRTTAEAVSAATLGSAVTGHPSRRRFLVRRQDVFARWLLSLAGDVRPVAPEAFVHRWQVLARETMARYEAVQ